MTLKLVFSTWRTLWGMFVTGVAVHNIYRLNIFFNTIHNVDTLENSIFTHIYSNTSIHHPPEHTHITGPIYPYNYYDPYTAYLTQFILCVTCIDICCMYVNRSQLYNIGIAFHHGIMVLLLSIAMYVPVQKSHHYYINIFISTEIVTITCSMPHWCKYLKLQVRWYRSYLVIYGVLTLIWRFVIWYYLLYASLHERRSHIWCTLGILPLLLLDVYWVYECIETYLKTFKKPHDKHSSSHVKGQHVEAHKDDSSNGSENGYVKDKGEYNRTTKKIQ